MSPFHVAIPVHDLAKAEEFYLSRFHCEKGRSSDKWIDLNLYGHQFVLHLVEGMDTAVKGNNPVDSKSVPVPHYGVVLEWEAWQELADHLKTLDTEFIIEPYVRFEGEVGEQATMFLLDPSGNALEFKAFKDISQLFAH
jgi:extradiol dioxygenase family protein